MTGRTPSRIFVLCPAGSVTGGPELLHQLVSTLKELGWHAAIAYTPLGTKHATPARYLKYACEVADRVEDSVESIVIAPETSFDLLTGFKKAVRVVWWLSVDNYRGNFDDWGKTKHWFKRTLNRSIRLDPGIRHLFQSEYSRRYVHRRFGKSGVMLGDYVSDDYRSIEVDVSRKLNQVAYNPRKGSRYTSTLIRLLPGVHFVPLEAMTAEQVRATLLQSKVYIDFGSHPGRDRIPREAALCACVVIVGRRGSARYFEDVPLSDRFKFPVGYFGLRKAANAIVAALGNYDTQRAEQSEFLDWVAEEPTRFREQVIEVFSSDFLRAAAGPKP